MRTFLSALAGGLLVALVVGVLAVSGAFDGSGDQPSRAAVTTATTPSASSSGSTGQATHNATDVSALYERVRDGVVNVQVQASRSTPFGPQEGQGSGSGFVLDKQGHILTNDHVVDNADRVRVRVGDGEKLVPAKVTGTDPSSDLAVLKVDPAAVDGLQPLALGSSGDLRVGEPAIAIGSPFGLEGSLTTGVVSALDRSIQAPNNFTISGAVQTDAAINPGNSGGPLLDAQGRVIGINAQIATSTRANSGVGFAIPVDVAKQAIPALKQGRRVPHAYLGVSTTQAADGNGVRVAQVIGGGPADDGGLRVGDRILSVAGEEVVESGDVAAAIAARKPSDRVDVIVERGGDRRTIQVTLGSQPQAAPNR